MHQSHRMQKSKSSLIEPKITSLEVMDPKTPRNARTSRPRISHLWSNTAPKRDVDRVACP
jgi:hypothetical protein